MKDCNTEEGASCETDMNAASPNNRNKRPLRIKSIPLTGLFVLALFYAAYASRAILLPIVLALFFTILLRPVVRFLKKFKIPEIVGAAFILCFFLATVGYGISLLSGPAEEWIKKAPESFRQISPKLKSMMEPAQRARKTVEDLQRMTGADKPKNQITVQAGPSIAVSVFTGTQDFIVKSAVMLMLLFFFLASGDLFFGKLIHLFPEYRDKNQALRIVQDVEQAVSRYLLTVTIINASEGLLVGIAMYLVGMPNPLLWGVMAALLIYVPYLGPLVGISTVAVVAALTFQDIGQILLAPGVYLAIEILQGQFLTPYILGARFALNPVVIILWLIFWGWFWSITGALIAVPMLTVFKICCDHIEPLKPISEFLSD
jgi:predicted PurR-regulated permease PerM